VFRAPDDGAQHVLLARDRLTAAQVLVSAFYAILLFFAAGSLFTWQSYLDTTDLAPRWPVFWLRWVELRSGIAAILWLHLGAAVLGATLARYRLVRILVFVSLLELLALRFSFGAVNHGDHLGVLLAFVLVFLPAGFDRRLRSHRRDRRDRRTTAATLLVVGACQGLIMLTYSMAGLWKVGGVVEQWLRGELVTYLHPHGLATQVAAKMLEDDGPTLLGPWIVEHAWVGWLPGVAALYLELFALWAAARPSLHRVWGVGLVLLHLSTHLTMGVGFPQNVLWLALFLVLSPLRPRDGVWWRAARDLPILGGWLARGRRVVPG
jgi:hypothetical protein